MFEVQLRTLGFEYYRVDIVFDAAILEEIAADNRQIRPIEAKKRLFMSLFYLLFMPLTRQKKEEVLTELKERIKDSCVVVFVNFHGLSTILNQELRRLINEAGAKYLVAKKTLIKKAMGEFKFSGQPPDLEGEIALVFGTGDAVLPLQSLNKFHKKHPEINLLGGVLEDAFLTKEDIAKLAKLPNREILIAQFINAINAPRRGVVVTLDGVIRNFVSVLSQIK